ncbi:hypothetical protein KAS41_04725 [Candidatus Parcubacteria bacterium]|nr:hypothetical protein [Candidatus Parcubacteria bacterium]
MFFDSILNKKFFKKRKRVIFLLAILVAVILSICIIRANIIKKKNSRTLIIDKSYFQGDSKESEIIKKYLNKKDKIYIELPRENKLPIIKVKIEPQKTSLISFFQNRKNDEELNLIAQNFLSKNINDLIFLQNINFKNLLPQYQNLTGTPFIDILQIENLSNNFNSEHKKTFLSLADNNIDLTIFPRNETINNLNDFHYFGRIKFKDSENLPEKIAGFENVIKHILAVQLPIEKRKVLPDGSYINELIADAKKFEFLDKNISGKNIRYIQEDKLNFILAYYIKGDEIIFSNNLDKLENEKFINLNSNYPTIIIPTKFLNYSNLAKKILIDKINKYQNIIFIENPQLKELNLIFL